LSETKSKGGRPPFQPTEQMRRQVEAMSSYGIPQEDIASVFDIHFTTLTKHFKRELKQGSIKANAKVGESLFLQAVGAPATYDEKGNIVRAEQPRITTAGIWWSKARMGWKEKVAHEHGGADGASAIKIFLDATDSAL